MIVTSFEIPNFPECAVYKATWRIFRWILCPSPKEVQPYMDWSLAKTYYFAYKLIKAEVKPNFANVFCILNGRKKLSSIILNVQLPSSFQFIASSATCSGTSLTARAPPTSSTAQSHQSCAESSGTVGQKKPQKSFNVVFLLSDCGIIFPTTFSSKKDAV